MYGRFIDDWKTPDEYISRKAAEEMIEDAQIISDGENCGYCTEDIEISSIPAADVAPVVHGKWLLKHIGAGHYWECSACHENPCIYVTNNTKFCPNCGAKMDGGKQP